MAKEICISTTPHETRLAILEDDQLAEIYYERENEYTLAGSIYKGRVTRVLPGMQSSFVDVGLERDAFLYVTDFLEEQEDSEDYVSESNRRPRHEQPAAEEAEAERNAGERGQDRSGERGGQGRGDDRSGERGGQGRGDGRNGEGRGDRSQIRSQEERGRRGAGAADGDRGDRSARERSREQVVAPLREAVPAAQDLEEKGDTEESGDADSPAGTRRWRGRRGRRRGVRGGLDDIQASPARELQGEPLERIEASSDPVASSYSTPERGAPGGIADPYVAFAVEEPGAAQAASDTASFVGRSEPERSSGRDRDRDRDRGGLRDNDRVGRRSREPYAQASTVGRLEQPVAEPSLERVAAAQGAPAPTGGAIVLPGESLSKYGSQPAPQASTSAIAPALKATRPVNYVAAKPSTLVESPLDWDGGATLPGETISRYRGPAPGAASSASVVAQPAKIAQTAESSSAPSFSEGDVAPQTTPRGEGQAPLEEVGLDQIDARAGDQAVAPLAEPEMVSAAVSIEAEAGEAHVEAPRRGNEVSSAATTHADAAQPSEPAEYEPEDASASYRVAPTGSSELRIASPEPAADQQEEPAVGDTQPSPADVLEAGRQAFAEPEGAFAEVASEQVHDAPAGLPNSEGHASPLPVPEFGGELQGSHDSWIPEPSEEASAHAEEEGAASAAEEGTQLGHALSILHEDGTIETVPVAAPGLSVPAETSSTDEPGHVAEAAEERGFELDTMTPQLSWAAQVQQADAELMAPPASSLSFAEMVDKLQGFSPGQGLIEEEVIDEEEYDFEPLHAHAHGEDGDHEDLEEETLDHHLEPAALSDAVRESHLNQRVHDELPVPMGASASVSEDLGSDLHLEELDEDEDEDEEESKITAQGTGSGEPQRAGRSDEDRSGGRDRGRGRGGARNGGRSSGGRNGGRGRSAQAQDLPVISDMLKQGQEILVQIAKEPIAKKGARITSHIALPGRFLVFMPTVSHVGVSRKIASDEERQRLKRILISEKGDSSGGFIVRTAAEGAGEEDLRADLRFLISLWTEIKQRSDSARAPALIYHDLNLIERILRDQVSSNFSTIWVDSEPEYERIIRFLNRFQPALVRRVKLYTKETPLFEHFGIQEEISKALKSKVWLKSGGSIVINQTEALVAIDINTGKYVGKTARLEDTIVKTNLDAISEIVRQIRLRDLGGIIVIDFIDMDERKNRNRVLAALEEELKHDRAPSKVLQFNDFGLVAITRKRVKQSLERTLSVTCEVCTGTGMVKSPVTVCNEIYTEMRKMMKHLDGRDVMLRVHPEVVKQLKAGSGKWINELEEMVAKTIIIKSDPALHPEQFDIH